MSKTTKKALCLTLAALSLTMTACGEKTPNPTEPSTLHQEETRPTQTAAPTEESRPQATVCPEVPQALVDRSPESVSGASYGTMAETENGYYVMYGSNLLYYADKSDLTNWVLVCNEPNCSHWGEGCSAYAEYYGFLLYEGRIYTLGMPEMPSLRSKTKFSIFSMAPDGTDRREERLVEEIPGGHEGGFNLWWIRDCVYYSSSHLNNDGNYAINIQRISGTGVDNLYAEITEDNPLGHHFSSPLSGTGDFAAYADLLPPEVPGTRPLFRFTADGYQELPGTADYKLNGGLLKGDSLYRYTPGEGYYYTDLSTGESVLWMEPQFPDGYAEIFGTDLVMETNLRFDTDPEVPEMRIFDGTEWKNVALPEGIWSGENHGFAQSSVVTSQHLFLFTYFGKTHQHRLYAIDLTADTLEAVLCGTFQQGL